VVSFTAPAALIPWKEPLAAIELEARGGGGIAGLGALE